MKILLPVDGSSQSLTAARYVADRLLPCVPGATLTLLHVRYRVPPRAAAAVGRAILEDYYRKETEAALKATRRMLDAKGIEYEALRVLGNPGTEIARWTGTLGADLVVMGSHGLGAAKGLLLGSVTQAVIAECRVPLLVVREGRFPPSNGEVLVAVDGSRYTRRAVAWLLRHRGMLAANNRICFAHVSPPAPRLASAAADAATLQQQKSEFERATRDARRLADRVRVKYKTLHLAGDPGERLAQHASGKHASLIVMGSHGRGSMTSLLLGSVAQKTLACGRTPVLIVR